MPLLKGHICLECAGNCCTEIFKWTLHNILFISSVLKAHWAIIKRIMGTLHAAFSEVSHPFTNTCFSKPRMRAKFLSGAFFKRRGHRAFSNTEECTSYR